ncbi:MAG TPA: hypothetical protein VK849_04175 [Longimicrobiales bacterium]|nr:hypothetical protein [Longimicrobiales bacterium]
MAEGRARPITPARVMMLSCTLAAGLLAFLLLPPIRATPGLVGGFLGAGSLLVAWAAALAMALRRAGRTLTLEPIARKHHWVQACAQLTLLLYWGWHVRPVYAFLPFVVAQLLFAYGLDALLNWTRRGRWQLGFGPVPIVLSINFFLWFKPQWFYWQFVIVLLGYVGKEFIRWTRDGRRRHIFNPSSFPLAVFSLVLILTGTTDATFGLEIASTLFNPPHIYVAIFLVALPAQVLFGVTTMTIASVLTAYAWGLVYFAATGTYYFRDAFIPIAVFLGMHLLFTDPSTSPRTESGRVVFGALYAIATIALAAVLEAVGAPTFYDKLLPIPLLNLTVRRIDRVADAVAAARWRAWALGEVLTSARRRLAVVGLWVATFVVMSETGALGDEHPGQYLPFWEESCEAGSERACEYMTVMQENYCDRGSGWACNELGIQRTLRSRDRDAALASMRRGCDLEFRTACENLGRMRRGEGRLARARPELRDLPIVLRGSKGPVMERTATELFELGCRRGWPDLCTRTTRIGPDASRQAAP